MSETGQPDPGAAPAGPPPPASQPLQAPPGPSIDQTGAAVNAAAVADQIIAGSLAIGTTIITTTADYDGVSTEQRADLRRSEKLRSDHFVRRSLNAVTTSDLVSDSTEIALLAAALRQEHLLFLSGAAESGKGTAALLAATQLRTRSHSLHEEVLHARLLPKNVQIDFSALACGSEYAHRVLIFEDALALGHRDLIRFAEELGSLESREIVGRLRDNEVYLVFTAESEQLQPYSSKLGGLGVLREIQGPGEGELRRFLHRLATSLVRKTDDSHLGQQVQQFLAAEEARLVKALRTAPRLERFAFDHLLSVARGELDIDESLRRMDNLQDWLLIDLRDDLPAWCFVLSLVLTAADQGVAGAPWCHVQRFWQLLMDHVRRALRRSTEARKIADLIPGPELLRRARAVVTRFPFPLGDHVGFKDTSYPERLWTVLMGPGRGVLTLLLPFLQAIAGERNFHLRIAAAGALGRLGEMDPRSLSLRFLAEWPRSDSKPLHLALGNLLGGILNRPEGAYRTGCLYRFRVLVRNPTEEVWALAVALREAGATDRALAVAELVRLIDGRLSRKIGELPPGRRDSLDQLDRFYHLSLARTILDPTGWNWNEKVRELLAPLLFTDDEREALAAVEYALTGLCFGNDPIQVLDLLRAQLTDDKHPRLTPLLTFLLLRDGGIGDRLGCQSFPLSEPVVLTDKRQIEAVSRLVMAAAVEDCGAERLSAVLEHVHHGLAVFPGLVRRSLDERFFALLLRWLLEAAGLPETQTAFAEVMARLLSAPDPALREAVFQLLKSKELTVEGSRPAELARSALTARPPRRPAALAGEHL